MYSHLHSPLNYWKQRDNQVQDSFLSYSARAEPGFDPGLPAINRALYPVVLRAFPLLQFSQRSITINANRQVLAETLQFWM